MLSGVKHSRFSGSLLESHTSGLKVDRVRQNGVCRLMVGVDLG